MTDTARKSAIVLLSGGLDSTTVVAIAQAQGFDVAALSFDYGQRHVIELEAARRVAAAAGVRRHEVLKIGLGSFGGSSLTDHDLVVPTDRLPADMEHGIPNTYVPARNTVFLSCALALAEVAGADDIFLGVNALDYSGYPDCRPEYIAAFQAMANLATAATVEGSRRMTIHAPLMTLTKSEIIAEGLRLGVDYSLTTSCYQANADGACGVCDSCTLRLKGFSEAGAEDPVLYRAA